MQAIPRPARRRRPARARHGPLPGPGRRADNFSFYGEAVSEKEEPIPIKRALEHLFHHHKDVLVVTAAGNRGTAEPVWPARFNEDFDQVIAVGALDGSVGPGTPLKASFTSSRRLGQ